MAVIDNIEHNSVSQLGIGNAYNTPRKLDQKIVANKIE